MDSHSPAYINNNMTPVVQHRYSKYIWLYHRTFRRDAGLCVFSFVDWFFFFSFLFFGDLHSKLILSAAKRARHF